MGWPTKGSGHSYNSNAGFGAFVGACAKKVLMSHAYCKRCKVCENAKLKNTPPNKHDCVQNYDTDLSSKAMEPAAILFMATEAPSQRQFVMHWIISDDDSVMRAHLKHPKPHLQKDKGKLPIWIYQPEFMADPGHRKKTVAKCFYKLASASAAVSPVTSDIAKRCKKNWGHVISQNRTCGDIDVFMEKAKAVVNHMFNEHKYCSKDWCLALKATEDGKQHAPSSPWMSCENPK